MFAFDISGLALEVAPPDTGRVDWSRSRPGCWKRGPTRSARTSRIGSREVCGYELVLGEAVATATPRPI